jgi:hypothetical protein
MIAPYMLRRIKADVLRLPPKASFQLRSLQQELTTQIEIIVPISLTPIQKHVYRGILEKHADLIRAVMAGRKKKVKPAPTITGGDAIVAPEVIGNAPKQTTETVTAGAKGKSILNPEATNGTEEVATSTSADIEMGEPTTGGTTSIAEVIAPVEKAIDKGIPMSTQHISDDAMVLDSDNTDSAQVEDTI